MYILFWYFSKEVTRVHPKLSESIFTLLNVRVNEEVRIFVRYKFNRAIYEMHRDGRILESTLPSTGTECLITLHEGGTSMEPTDLLSLREADYLERAVYLFLKANGHSGYKIAFSEKE